MPVTINYTRVGDETTIYTAQLIDDDGTCVRLFSEISQEHSRRWSSHWWSEGLIPEGEYVASVTKYHFYDEHFSIMVLRNEEDTVLGYYCDIVTPLQMVDGEYYLYDLVLDLWITPDLSARELDWDEFHEAVEEGLLSPKLAEQAKRTLQRLQQERADGTFPAAYLDE